MRSRLVENPLRSASQAEKAGFNEALAFHRSLPGYAPTPLVDARHTATALGVRRAWVTDESHRLGMPSFKILGAAWACYRALCDRLGLASSPVRDLADLRAELADGDLCLVAATDGNHGRAVARMARMLGIASQILVPADMASARQLALKEEGAWVTVVSGTYDDAVERSAALGDERHLVVSDTRGRATSTLRCGSWTATRRLARRSPRLRGDDAPAPAVVAAQIGVGALAAAMIRFAAGSGGARVIGVEPLEADCAARSIAAGALVEAPGPHRSMMAGLNCARGVDRRLALPACWTAVRRRRRRRVGGRGDAADGP